VDLHRVDFDLTALVEELICELRESEPARTVEVVVHSGMRAMADPVLVRSVMSNLIANAWKFTSKRSGARVEIGQGGAEGDMGVFFVRDNGAGFDMQHAQKLFGLFQRLHNQQEFGGTGVGLATVERIVSRHGGRIWAEGQSGRGATFYFTLPAPSRRSMPQ